jgi:lipoprotein signal peptidase
MPNQPSNKTTISNSVKESSHSVDISNSATRGAHFSFFTEFTRLLFCISARRIQSVALHLIELDIEMSCSYFAVRFQTIILLKSTKWWAPASASKWQMRFNSAFKGLNTCITYIKLAAFSANRINLLIYGR